MKKTIVTLVLMLGAGSLAAAELIEAVVIRVGDRIITRTQYEKRLRQALAEIDQMFPPDQAEERKKELRGRFVDELINEMLIKDRADRIGVTVTAAEIKDAILSLRQRYNITSDEQFESSLRQWGLSPIDLETGVRDSLIMQQVFARELRSRAQLEDRELRERYDREKERYRLPERVRLREIVILRPANAAADSARARAEEAAATVRGGADFAKTASTVSEAATKDKGGDLGEVARGELLAELDKEVFNANAGAIVGPIETRAGWHVLKVEQRLPSEVPAFESIKDRLRRDASEETMQRDQKAYLERLRKDAFIQIHEKNIPTI